MKTRAFFGFAEEDFGVEFGGEIGGAAGFEAAVEDKGHFFDQKVALDIGVEEMHEKSAEPLGFFRGYGHDAHGVALGKQSGVRTFMGKRAVPKDGFGKRKTVFSARHEFPPRSKAKVTKADRLGDRRVRTALFEAVRRF